MNSRIERIKKMSVGTIIAKILYYIIKKPIIIIMKNMELSISNNKIVFDSVPDFSDNSKCFYEYIINKCRERYEIVWLVDNIESTPANIKTVKKRGKLSASWTISAFYHIFTARIVIYTHTMNFRHNVNYKKQIFLNLWHGCGYKAPKSSGEKIDFDYCLVPGDLFINTKSKFFGCDEKKIIPIGYPRYDWLLKENSHIREWLTAPFNKKNKIVMWMPTFRNSNNMYISEGYSVGEWELPLIESKDDLDNINKFCEKNKIFIYIKYHSQQRCLKKDNNYKNIKWINDEIINSKGYNLYEVIGQMDGLITDYSSVAVDYLLLNRPIAYILSDIDKYEKTRGFVFEDVTEYMPGHHVYTIEGLLDYLYDVCIENDLYENDRAKMLKIMHNQTSDYCKRVYDFLEREIK